MFILYYLLAPIIGLAILRYTRYRTYDTVTIIAVMSALAFYYTYFFLTPWYQFAPDPYEHVNYIKIIAEKHYIPKPLETSATRHPPTYYVVAAALYTLAQMVHDPNPIGVMRHLSVALYMVFIACNIELLRLFSPKPAGGYYAGLLMLLFWPLGITISGRINCDLLLYAGQAGVLLALAYWFKTEHIRCLTWAFICAGICILAKNTGIIMVMLTCLVWLYSVLKYRHKKWSGFFMREQLLAMLFIISSYAITKYHSWVTSTPITEVEHHTQAFYWQSFITLDPLLLITDTSVGDSQGMFWNVLLHSIVLGNVLPWKLMNSLMLFNTCWVIIILYIVWGLKGAESVLSRSGKEIAATFIIYIILSLAGMTYMMLQSGNLLYADAKYLYPIVGVIALTFSWVTERHYQQKQIKQYQLGKALAIIFVCLSVMLFTAQWVL